MRCAARLFVLVAAVLFSHLAFPQATPSQERWFVYASLLNTHDSDLIRLAAKGIERGSVRDQRLMDMVARVLTEQMDGERLLNADTIAWLAKALGATKSKRYSAVLERLVANQTGNVAKHATLALAQLVDDAAAFAPESVVWSEIAAEIEATAMSNRQNRRLHAASMGMSIEEVVKLLGYPTSVGTEQRARRASYARFSVNNLLFAYEARGLVEFVHSGGEWRTSLISPDLLPSQIAEQGTVTAQIREGLVGDDPREFRRASTMLLHQRIFDPTTLELAAWRLQSHYKSSDALLVDGMAHICVAFEETRNARYRKLLELVAAEATTNKLKRHAKGALDDVPTDEVAPFTGVFD